MSHLRAGIITCCGDGRRCGGFNWHRDHCRCRSRGCQLWNEHLRRHAVLGVPPTVYPLHSSLVRREQRESLVSACRVLRCCGNALLHGPWLKPCGNCSMLQIPIKRLHCRVHSACHWPFLSSRKPLAQH